VQGDGRIVLGGVAGNALPFGLRRLKADGTPDGTTFEELEYASTAAALAVQPGGAIVVAGTALPPESPLRSVVARYEPGGALDETFAGTGSATLGPHDVFHPVRLLVQPDGALLVLGGADPADPKMVVARLTGRGEVDRGFGVGGFAIPDFDGQDHAAAIALQPDGQVLVVGTTLADTSFAIARLGAGGALDGGFGSAGRTTVALGPRSAAYSAALQRDGKLVVAGLVIDGDELNLGVARLLLSSSPPATMVGTPGRDRLIGGPGRDRARQ
jgi:uncharacterized delta-60 repeat protein